MTDEEIAVAYATHGVRDLSWRLSSILSLMAEIRAKERLAAQTRVDALQVSWFERASTAIAQARKEAALRCAEIAFDHRYGSNACDQIKEEFNL